MQRPPCTSAIKISSSKPRCSILIEYSRTRRHLVHRMNPRTNKKLDLVVLPCPSLFPHQPSQPLQEHDGPEQPPKKARARFTGEMGLGKERVACFVEAPRPRISEACFPYLNSCFCTLKSSQRIISVSLVSQSYRSPAYVARSAKLHVLNTCVLSRRKTRISMSQRILHRTRCLGPQLLI